MAGVYLTDLAYVLRKAGLTVIEEPGWRTRGRSSGGYLPGRPSHLMIHHTVSSPRSDGQGDVNYICYGAPDRPITNFYTDRRGQAWICAAGATNTNGKGVDTWGGGVPVDSMNTHAISNEIANTGIGEPYPEAQQESVLTSSAAIVDHYNIDPHCIRGHFEWAPTRKIDPSGPSRWAPNGGKWSMNQFRTDVALHLPHGEPDMIGHVQRIFDSRPVGKFKANTPVLVELPEGFPPANLLFLAVTATNATAPGYVASGTDVKANSVASFVPGVTSTTGVMLPSMGGFWLTTLTDVDLIIDVTAYQPA